MNFNGADYHYLYNLQGDVVGLIDNTGTLVVEYNYDAWGRIIGRTGSLVGTLGWLNPFRYRGYVYDEETRMYYLKSRYYNPEWGRFINADVVLGSIGALEAHNTYVYCYNSPVDKSDPDGCIPLILTMGAGTILACGLCGIAVSSINWNLELPQFDAPTIQFLDVRNAYLMLLLASLVSMYTSVDVATSTTIEPTTSASISPSVTPAPSVTPNPDKKYYIAIAYGGRGPVPVSPPFNSRRSISGTSHSECGD